MTVYRERLTYHVSLLFNCQNKVTGIYIIIYTRRRILFGREVWEERRPVEGQGSTFTSLDL